MKVVTLLLAGCAVITMACSKPLRPTYAGYQNLRLAKIGFRENIIAAEVKLYNPNNYPLQVKEADLDLYLNGHFVGNTHMQTLTDLAAKDTTMIPLELKATAKNLLFGAAPLLLNSNVKVRIDGTVKAGRKGFFKSVLVNYEGQQRIPLLKDSVRVRLYYGYYR
jgi:LEA14-like dessication related protein